MEHDRRTFLKLLVFGSGFFAAGKIFGNFWDFFSADPDKTVFFKNFKITENSKTLGVYDSNGDEILLIDKDQ